MDGNVDARDINEAKRDVRAETKMRRTRIVKLVLPNREI